MAGQLERSFREMENMIASHTPMDFTVRAKRLSWPPQIQVDARHISNRLYTPLMLAAAHNKNEVVDKLVHSFIAAPAQTREAVDVQSSWGFSALMIACVRGYEMCVRSLVPHADLELRDNEGCTALMLAIVNSHGTCAEILLNAGASLSLENHYGYACLHVAIQTEQNSIVSRLIRSGASVNQLTRGTNMTPLDVAALHDDTTSTVALLSAGANPNHHEPKTSPLGTAAFRSNFAIFDLLVTAGADVNSPLSFMGTALTVAAYAGDGNIMRRALSAGGLINIRPCFDYKFPRHFNARVMQQGRNPDEDEDQSGLASNKLQHDVYCMRASAAFHKSPYAVASRMDDASMLLLASGENTEGIRYFQSSDAPEQVAAIREQKSCSLVALCREVIRGQIVAQGHNNLFEQVKKLPVPPLMQKYLVYNQSLDIGCDRCAQVAGSGGEEDITINDYKDDTSEDN